MLKGLMILVDGFEDTEAIATFDVLSRSGINMTTATHSDNLLVLSQYNHQILAKTSIDQVKASDYDFLVIPGGKAVVSVLNTLQEVDDLILDFINQNKLVAAICAAPLLLGKQGYFKDIEYTCFPGFEEKITAGYKKDDGVVITDKFITGKSMYYSIDFALAIIEKLQGKDQKVKVLKSLKGER